RREEKSRHQARHHILRESSRRIGYRQGHENPDENAEEIQEKNLVDIRQTMDRHQKKMHPVRIRSPLRIDLPSVLEQLEKVEVDVGVGETEIRAGKRTIQSQTGSEGGQGGPSRHLPSHHFRFGLLMEGRDRSSIT